MAASVVSVITRTSNLSHSAGTDGDMQLVICTITEGEIESEPLVSVQLTTGGSSPAWTILYNGLAADEGNSNSQWLVIGYRQRTTGQDFNTGSLSPQQGTGYTYRSLSYVLRDVSLFSLSSITLATTGTVTSITVPTSAPAPRNNTIALPFSAFCETNHSTGIYANQTNSGGLASGYTIINKSVTAGGQTATSGIGNSNAIAGIITAYPSNSAPTSPGVFSEPDSGGEYDNSIAVAWGAATDIDGDTLTYDLDYWNGSAWIDIVNQSGLTYSWNTTPLSARSDYKLRVRASDGSLSSAFVESGTFSIRHAIQLHQMVI